jgi:hypothetical protein
LQVASLDFLLEVNAGDFITIAYYVTDINIILNYETGLFVPVPDVPSVICNVFQVTYAVQGTQGLQGTQGTQGVQGVQGLQGLQGIQGVQGIQGLDGAFAGQGIQGVQGVQGLRGESTTYFQYTANTTSFAPVPSAGNILWNNATQTSATILYVSHLTSNGVDVDLFLDAISIGDTIIVQDQANSLNYQQYVVSASVIVVPNSYVEIPVTYVGGGYSFSNFQPLIFAFTSIGVQGTQGTQGLQGTTGSQGSQGLQGLQGIQGVSGVSGQASTLTGSSSTLSVTSATTTYTALAGLIQTINIPASCIVLIHTDGGFNTTSTTSTSISTIDIAIFVDGLQVGNFATRRLSAFNPSSTAINSTGQQWSIDNIQTGMSVASHTFDVRAVYVIGSTASVGSNSTNQRQANLIVTILKI